MLSTGVDIIEVARIDAAILRHRERFFQRFFTTQELIEAEGRTPALAARFAAKEAVAKALGCGIGDVGWKEIEIPTLLRCGDHDGAWSVVRGAWSVPLCCAAGS
jgi:holo-[acyl-carrier protein] synthase